MSTSDGRLSSTDSAAAIASIPNSDPIREGRAPPRSKGRFDIEIRSVYYYADGDGVCAAVVLKTSFILDSGRQLKYSECPVTVHAEGDNNERLPIVKYHPLDEEFVQVDYHTGRKEWTLNPSVNLPQGGGQIGSMTSSRSNDKPTIISLQAANRQERIPRITWYFKDSKKSLYPSCVEVLLIVRKNSTAAWFKFNLKLMEELKVDIHGQIPSVTDFFDRLVGVPERGCDGWYFEIQGRYNEDHAKKAITSLDTNPSVGLKSAAQSMLGALKKRRSTDQIGQ